MNKKVKSLLVSMSIILTLTILQTLPVLMLKPVGAREIKGKSIIVYYESGDEKGAKEIFDVLENAAGDIREKLGLTNTKPTNIFVYANQKSLWIRKYGLITVLAAPQWYIGDNKGDDVLIISTYTNVKGNDHNSILHASIHELVHTINYQINPKLSYWNDNGVATFLARQAPSKDFTKYMPIPAIDDLKSEDEKRFGNIGGYEYSYTYVEFLNNKYGWNKIVDLVRGKKTYGEIFSKSEQEIYNEWVQFLKEKYK